MDVITYAGEISVPGYELVCQALSDKKASDVLLILATPGGDPHAGYRIARALQHTYERFDALVPRYCKSAGTLILIGARKVYLDDRSELGPLDIQIKKGDELIGRNSGLDIFQAVNFLQNQSINSFRSTLLELTGDGLSTRVASEIAVKLTVGLLEPIAEQIDPIKLAEMQRATEIAFEYGNRLNETSGTLRSGGIQRLVSGYPSHGFVIDRKEARTIFANVHKPEGFLQLLSRTIGPKLEHLIGDRTPSVELYHFPDASTANENASVSSPGSGSSPSGKSEIAGDSAAGGPAEGGEPALSEASHFIASAKASARGLEPNRDLV